MVYIQNHTDPLIFIFGLYEKTRYRYVQYYLSGQFYCNCFFLISMALRTTNEAGEESEGNHDLKLEMSATLTSNTQFPILWN